MIKTVVKLLVALAIVNAVARVGMAAWDYYQLKDAAQELLLFGAGIPTAELSELIFDRAMDLGVPLERENLEVERTRNVTVVRASYTQPIELFPRFIYPFDVSFSVEEVALTGLQPRK